MNDNSIQVDPIEVDRRSDMRGLLRPRTLDRLEQVVIVMLWMWLAWRVFASANGLAWLALISETAIMFFVLIRRPTEQISLRLGDWLLAITATLAPLLIVPGPSLWQAVVPLGIGLILFGNFFQLWAKFCLRRSFGIGAANRGIKVGGPYRVVRHPMYAGYLAVHVGIFLTMPSAINLLIYVIAWWAQLLRLNAEERLLAQDESYRQFMGRTRWRLIPGAY